MRYAYYHSCSLRSTGKEYNRSLQAVCGKLGIELVELKDWMCCGAAMAHNVDNLLALSLPMKNLAEVEKAGFDKLLVPCTACYARFKVAQYETEHNPGLKDEIEDIIEYKFKGKVEVLHPLEALSQDEVLAKIKSQVVKDISRLKVVSYYGCLLLRPPKMTGFKDNFEYPVTMDKILIAAGIKTLDWSFKTECCGGSLSITRPDIVCELSQRIFDNAKEVGADIISVPCTFCHLNLDARQEEIEKRFEKEYKIPIFYFTQLVALALGIPQAELMLDKHFIAADKVLEKVA